MRGLRLTAIQGGMNRLRDKGDASPDQLIELTNGYVSASGTVESRPGTTLFADLDPPPPAEFITTWKTDNLSFGSSNDDQIRLPLVATFGIYNFVVDWGDGTEDTITSWNQVEATHTYPAAGTYTVTISGALNRWMFVNNASDRLKVLTVEQWGTDCVYQDYNEAWNGCSNVVFNAADVPNVSGCFSFFRAWRNCFALTSFPLIDTSGGGIFEEAWLSCRGLTEFPLLDVSNGTTFRVAWLDCEGLTEFPLLDVSSGQNFSLAWSDCEGLTSFPLLVFNQFVSLNFQSAWRNCTNLETLPALNVGAATSFVTAFSNTGKITSAPLQGTNAQISFATNQLDAAALDAIYTGLADRTAMSSLTIFVSGNPGTSGDDPSIATAKNWVVSGS